MRFSGARRGRGHAGLEALASGLEAVGANLTLVAPPRAPIRVGRHPEAARVVFRGVEALAPLARRDHLALAEAYLAGRIDVEGDLLEVLKVTELIPPGATRLEQVAFALRWLLRNRRRYQRESVAFHYDRPPEFFLPWFDRWRSYSHGFYESPTDTINAAQARKLQFAIDALGLKPGMEVFDMGCGWGPFVEFAGLQGIRVRAITISEQQHRFVEALIRERGLPCSVELVDFLDYRPAQRFDGAVFMGTFEHFGDYRRAAAFLGEWLAPEGRVYADFCTARGSRQGGSFLTKHIWPGAVTYVDVAELLDALVRRGFNVHALRDDTRSYACTVRTWADALEARRREMAARWGEQTVRAFLLFLRASQYFLERNKTQAYHLVAGRGAAGLERMG